MTMYDSPSSPLVDALYKQFQASLQLIRVALELEWTIFTRFTVGVVVATIVSVIYLAWTLRRSRHPLVVWEKLNKPLIKLFRPTMFAYLLANVNPYVGTIDMRVSTFSRGFCTGIMRDRHMNRNPFKNIHATAIGTLAESVGELALLSSLKDKDQAELVSLKIEFKKEARGLLTASCNLSESENDESKSSLETSVVVVKDRMLDTVAIAYLEWDVKRNDV